MALYSHSACFSESEGVRMSSGRDGPRRRSNFDETTASLLEAAAAAFIEHGYGDAAITDIARRAGVTTGAIYARWPGKNEVMAAAVDRIFEQLLPEQRLRELGVYELPAVDIFVAWGRYLLARDETQDVLLQVFSSARNNEAVQERLKQFLNDQADQMSRIVERGKAEVPSFTGLDSAAISLMVQAIGIGAHLLLSSGLEDRHIPSEQDWAILIESMLMTGLGAPAQELPSGAGEG